jgi:hypothetical protein
MNKLESFIKHWVNPSKWYKWREESIKAFLIMAKSNGVKPEDVEFVIKKNSTGQIICEPEVKNRNCLPNTEDQSNNSDIDRLREYLKQFPIYNNRIENGENVVDIAISIIKKYSKQEEIQNQSNW